MSVLDAATRQRLDRLRETDSSGVYASEDFTEGHDPDGALTVTVDPTNRVAAVAVHHVDLVRTPELLGVAIDRAYAYAIGARIAAVSPSSTRPAGEMPVARSVHIDVDVRRPQHPTHERPERPVRPARPPIGRVEGLSDNECVSVVLEPAGSRGTVHAEPGWLQQTTAARLGAAIHQAFAAAYQKRDLP